MIAAKGKRPFNEGVSSLLSMIPANTVKVTIARYPLFSCNMAFNGIRVVGSITTKNHMVKKDIIFHSLAFDLQESRAAAINKISTMAEPITGPIKKVLYVST